MDDVPCPVVGCEDADPAVVARLREVAERTGAFTIGFGATADVHVFTVEDGTDGTVVAQLRARHRTDPSVRTVVIGRGTSWFEAAFDAGADAWIDRNADDETVVAAITGRPTTGSAGSRSRRRGRRGRGLSLQTLALGRA